MIFSGIFEKFWDKELVWGLHQWAISPWGADTPCPATQACGAHRHPLHSFLLPSYSPTSRKNRFAAQTRVLAHLAGIFDLFAQITVLRTILGKLLLGK